ncbi:MAG: hypothetical protein IKB70_03315 [Bacilli bacterium]|nr:hypothetical protein [Bacilli bacterium]
MTEEIVRTKKYKRPQIIHCGSCPHCISFINYGDIENYYCLVDDKYKINDYPKEKDCPFMEGK